MTTKDREIAVDVGSSSISLHQLIVLEWSFDEATRNIQMAIDACEPKLKDNQAVAVTHCLYLSRIGTGHTGDISWTDRDDI